MQRPKETAPKLSHVLQSWRLLERLSVEQAAAEIGIEPQQLTRLEQGRKPSHDVLAAVLLWLLKSSKKAA